MIEPTTHHYDTVDGVTLAWREIGEGRAVVLLHGFISDNVTNWIRYGHAVAIAAKGFRVVMPDLRGHGLSGRPHDAAAYPPDILADDALQLIAHLGLTDYDLGGYSLGGRTVVRMLARGATPRRAIVAGMGLSGITDTAARVAHFRTVFDRLGRHRQGSAAWFAEAFMKTNGGDPVALALVLEAAVDTPLDVLATIPTPTLVLCGADDNDNGSAAELAAALPHGTLRIIPGTHMSAVAKPDLGHAMAEYLAA